jgi:hypothetical protein
LAIGFIKDLELSHKPRNKQRTDSHANISIKNDEPSGSNRIGRNKDAQYLHFWLERPEKTHEQRLLKALSGPGDMVPDLFLPLAFRPSNCGGAVHAKSGNE